MVANPYFFNPQLPTFSPQNPLFSGYFALFGHVFHGSKRFCLYTFSGCLCFSYCIKYHFALRFAPFYPAFSTFLPCVLVLNAGYFAANSPKVGANGGSLEYKFILPHSHAAPFLHQNEPSRESFFCDKVSTWWIKRALMMLNFLLKIRQKYLCRRHVRGQRHRNHIHLLSTVRAVARYVAHGQRIQHYGNAEVRLPLTASFQLVDGALNAFCQAAFLKT